MRHPQCDSSYLPTSTSTKYSACPSQPNFHKLWLNNWHSWFNIGERKLTAFTFDLNLFVWFVGWRNIAELNLLVFHMWQNMVLMVSFGEKNVGDLFRLNSPAGEEPSRWQGRSSHSTPPSSMHFFVTITRSSRDTLLFFFSSPFCD